MRLMDRFDRCAVFEARSPVAGWIVRWHVHGPGLPTLHIDQQPSIWIAPDALVRVRLEQFGRIEVVDVSPDAQFYAQIRSDVAVFHFLQLKRERRRGDAL
jgi:hypothetical protein